MKPTILAHSFEIYVPSHCRCGKPLPDDLRAEILGEVKATMAGWFGGGSARKIDPRVERIQGIWDSGCGKLDEEFIDVVQSHTDEDTRDETFTEFTAYVAQLANRLTQQAMACRVAGKMFIYPATTDPKPHRCAGGATTTTTPKPQESGALDRKMALQAALQRLGSANDVRDIFCNLLHYKYQDATLPTARWPDPVKQCLAPGAPPQVIAAQNGFKIIYLQLADASLRKASERQLVQRLVKEDPSLRGLVVVSDVHQKQWNLVNVKFDRDGKNRDQILLRRMRVGPGQPVRTAVERLSQVDVEILGEAATAADLQDKHDDAFDVEAVTKQFFSDIANWYFWALKHAQFPKDAPKEDDGHDHVSLIRLITRLIFCWFLREKGLIPDTLFDRRQLNDILTGFAPDKVRNKDSVFYRAILQNLFFATLSQNMGNDEKGRPFRRFAPDGGYLKNRSNHGMEALYRYEKCFHGTKSALKLFETIPFLNGGLFECLDFWDKSLGKKKYIDGFSRDPKYQPVVPDFLFFGKEQEIDLSADYGDRRFRNVRVRGLIDTLRHYNFTIEENTPIEEEVALDPELSGKVFENLLAAYNPETNQTARKQSGSFYTPREIVNYMVDEALIAYLSTKLEAAIPTAKDIEPRLRQLFGYQDDINPFNPKETTALIAAIDTLKSLDPAVGSGAFPMGLLHKLVFILDKLDRDNVEWRELQRNRAVRETEEAFKLGDKTQRENRLKEINEVFDQNASDYGRKLYLIENCIYGVDIQPIAVQIAKMRFFISLIVDQKIDDALPNRGIRPLPNLETKFVAANTLIGLVKPETEGRLFSDPKLSKLTNDLSDLRHRMFTARTPADKQRLRDKDDAIRMQMTEQLKAKFAGAAKEEEAKIRQELKQAETDLAAAKSTPPEWKIIQNKNLFGETEEIRIDLSKEFKQRLALRVKELEGRLQRASHITKEIDIIATQLASWNPFDQNASAEFFDAEWMFGMTDGFDFVIGNPPYGADIPPRIREIIDRIYQHQNKSADSYLLFIEKAHMLLKPHGLVSYIVSNTWLPSLKFQKIRRFLTSVFTWKNLLVVRTRVFSAVVDTNVFLFEKSKPSATGTLPVNYFTAAGVRHAHNLPWEEVPKNGDAINVVFDPKAQTLFRKMSVKSIPLKEIADVYNGVKPFEKGKGTPPQTAETMRTKPFVSVDCSKPAGRNWMPLLRGSLIHRYVTYWENNSWIQYGPWLAAPRDSAIFDAPEKLFIRQTGDSVIATYGSAGFIARDNLHIVLPKKNTNLLFVLGILNSNSAGFLYTYINPERGEVLAQVKKNHVEELPIPSATVSQQRQIIETVKTILAAKKQEITADTSALEREIDQLVYALYGLNQEEIQIVESVTS